MVLKWTNPRQRPRRVGVLLFERFSNLCLANCIEPMRAANTLAGGPAYEWQVLNPDGGPEGGPVMSSSDLPILGAPAADARGFDLLMVLASYDFEAHDSPATRALLRRLSRGAQAMAGFDTAPWLMASAGLLDGRRATIHWDLIDTFAERFPRVEVDRARVIRDGNRTTCAGALSALDHSFDMVRTDLGAALTLEIEALFLRDGLPLGRAARARDDLVRQAVQIMRDTLADPLPVAELARRVSCQPRTLDRRFRAVYGAPPGQVYRHLRLALARQLAEAGTLSVAEIADRAGYENAPALARAFRRRYGHAPSELRRGPRNSR